MYERSFMAAGDRLSRPLSAITVVVDGHLSVAGNIHEDGPESLEAKRATDEVAPVHVAAGRKRKFQE